MAERFDQSERMKAYGRIVARAWSDRAFKQRLLADPASVLREFKIDVPAGRQVRVVEETDAVGYFVLPAQPGDLSFEQLEKIAAGMTGTSCSTSSP
ncbi:MAG TPA: NHLP leader peptide family RiPP precursor [bacterium]|nr:NHLP leader peptide family RiPP precursor [bacterium]